MDHAAALSDPHDARAGGEGGLSGFGAGVGGEDSFGEGQEVEPQLEGGDGLLDAFDGEAYADDAGGGGKHRVFGESVARRDSAGHAAVVFLAARAGGAVGVPGVHHHGLQGGVRGVELAPAAHAGGCGAARGGHEGPGGGAAGADEAEVQPAGGFDPGFDRSYAEPDG